MVVAMIGSFSTTTTMPRKRYTSLIAAFNDFVDFVVLVSRDPEPLWEAVEWPRQATHHLKASLWDEKKNLTRSEGDREVDPSKARAVCAIPMKRKYRASHLKIARPLPRSARRWPVYKCEAPLTSKRNILLQYATLTGCNLRYRGLIKLSDDAECDALLKEFVAASRHLRAKWKRTGKYDEFWAKRKAALQAAKSNS